MRAAKKRNLLTETQVRELDQIGFTWSIDRQRTCEQRFKELESFMQAYGYCNVPRQYESNPALGHWVDNVRQQKKRGELDKEVIRCLNTLGFCWVQKTTWEQRIDDLTAFKEKHGHCNAPWEEWLRYNQGM